MFKKILLGGLGFFVFLVFIGIIIGDGDEEVSSTPEEQVTESNQGDEAAETTDEPATEEEADTNEGEANADETEQAGEGESDEFVYDGQQVFRMNEAVQAGELTYVANQIYAQDRIEGDFEVAETSGMFLIVDLDIMNNDNEARMIDSAMLKVIDANSGSTFDPDSTATRLASGGLSFFLENVNPEFTVNGMVAFEVPDLDRPFILEVDSGMMFAGGDSQYIFLESVE
ncbi:DUF4352 domain-containing protein [Desertibacillus haloalkaliphilus]|uniref:DUF4352 domain-containing protein n=1 Tax=Desertibacillus haloalkaliphilus TaxID=1328930 RepID=UPI001C26C202|nr:DUF4352 domain-containing protein [Desertibacillus haloalkaliphilus]MBU8906502.1 DUF4352 domain-containing protein [Desertibacillus haloalkaliphilus]